MSNVAFLTVLFPQLLAAHGLARAGSVTDPGPRASRNASFWAIPSSSSVTDPGPRASRNKRAAKEYPEDSVTDPGPRASRNSGLASQIAGVV